MNMFKNHNRKFFKLGKRHHRGLLPKEDCNGVAQGGRKLHYLWYCHGLLETGKSYLR